MDSENQEVIHCADDEYRAYCENCAKLCIERYHKNHFKSATHNSSIRKRQQLNKSFQIISLN